MSNNPTKDKAAGPSKGEGPRFIINVQESFESDRRRPSFSSQKSSSFHQQQPTPTLHVFVTAHPDDESMFFLPTMNALMEAGEIVWLLCLSSGNYDGLGHKRKAELSRVCHLLKLHKLICLDHKELQDHPTKSWSMEAVSAQIKNALQTALREETFEHIIFITFDEYGVSGHINHCDTHRGVRNLIQKHDIIDIKSKSNKSDEKSATTNLPSMEAWQLETVHFLPAKYIPIVGWFLIIMYLNLLWKPTYTPLPKCLNSIGDVNRLQVYRSINPMLAWKAMATHESQFVWYRRLFVVFSCYTFVNKLRPIQQP